jgi:hypothetical protein
LGRSNEGRVFAKECERNHAQRKKAKETSYTKGKHNKKEGSVEIIERERKGGAEGKAEGREGEGSTQGDVPYLLSLLF